MSTSLDDALSDSEIIIVSDMTIDVGKSRKSQRDTALNKFDDFLKYQNNFNVNLYPFQSFNELHDGEFFTPTLFSFFASYLYQVVKVKKLNTMHSYLSQMKNYVLETYPENSYFQINNDKWYSNLRTKFINIYQNKCEIDQTHLVDHAPKMTLSDLKSILYILMSMSQDRNAIEDRAIIVWQWFCLGRINEIANLNANNLKFTRNRNISVIEINIVRFKVSKNTDLSFVLHSNSWVMCPYHALATMFACLKVGI